MAQWNYKDVTCQCGNESSIRIDQFNLKGGVWTCRSCASKGRKSKRKGTGIKNDPQRIGAYHSYNKAKRRVMNPTTPLEWYNLALFAIKLKLYEEALDNLQRAEILDERWEDRVADLKEQCSKALASQKATLPPVTASSSSPRLGRGMSMRMGAMLLPWGRSWPRRMWLPAALRSGKSCAQRGRPPQR